MKLYKKDSTIFLLPLYVNKQSTAFTTNFKTTYIRDERFPHLDKCLIATYEGQNSKLESQHKLYGVSYNGNGEAFYYLELEDVFYEDYNNFVEGKYSKFSPQAKKRIIDFWKVNNDSLIYGILHKTTYAKTMYFNKLNLKNALNKDAKYIEYWKRPNLSQEYFSLAN